MDGKMTRLLEWTIERGLESYDVMVDYRVTSWGDPGRYSGPPEHCYPAEPIELELVAAWTWPPPWARGKYPNDLMPFALTQAERAAIEDHLCENPPDADFGPDPDDERDRRYDERGYRDD